MITIYVGDVDESVREAALVDDLNATLITQENCESLKSGTYYTSLGDLYNIETLVKVFDQANKLIYSPPTNWSDANMQYWTEFYLHYYKNRIDVVMEPTKQLLSTIPGRKHSKPQLWVAGCSITLGVGVDDNERYGQLLADELNIPVTFLAESAASIEWAADQILRSDIKAGDTLVWGVTSTRRFYYYDTIVKHITVSYYERDPGFNNIVNVDRLADLDRLYKGLAAIHQVINFCNKINVKLYLAGVFVSSTEELKHLSGLPNYIQFYGWPSIDCRFLDFGSDGHHPGPKTHQWYADILLDKIKHE